MIIQENLAALYAQLSGCPKGRNERSLRYVRRMEAAAKTAKEYEVFRNLQLYSQYKVRTCHPFTV